MLRGGRSLEFFNGQMLLVSRKGASEQYKFLSPQAVAAAFRNKPFDSGWLTPGIIRCGSTSRGEFALLFVVAGIHKIEVEASRSSRVQTLKVPLPGLLFFGYGKQFLIWATKDPAPTPKSALFHAPLPNVFEDGRVCWGSNKPPRPNAATIRTAFDLFISSPFSSHAANGKSRSHNGDVRPLLRGLNHKKTFPAGELLSQRETLQPLIDRTMGGAAERDDDEGELLFVPLDPNGDEDE